MNVPKVVYRLNDNYIEIQNLRNGATEDIINGATVECTLKDLDGNEITGETWPLSMPYVSSSSGYYRAVLESALDLTDIEDAVAYIDITYGTLVAHVELPLDIQDRTGL